jgi:hypothetical protein
MLLPTPLLANGKKPLTTQKPSSVFVRLLTVMKVDNNVVFVQERGQIRPATVAEKAGRIAVAEV